MRTSTLLLLATSTGLAHGQDSADDAQLLTSFDGAGMPLRWVSVNDGVMGGRSSGSFEIADGRLVFSGSLNTNGGGFASIRSQPSELDLGMADGIRLRARGDGRVYTMRLQQRRADGRGSVSYRAEFRPAKGDAWREFWLPFETFVPTWRGRVLDLPAVDPSRVDSLGLQIADKIDGPFRLEVDSIHACASFSLDAHRGRHRLLVAFAPSLDDDRLVRQIAAVEASQAAFDDRDMMLVVVAAQGGRAGVRPLSEADSGALRRRLEIADEDEFAVRLVGMDGGVKHRAAEPVEMASIYDLIDRMPLRRAELERTLARD